MEVAAGAAAAGPHPRKRRRENAAAEEPPPRRCRAAGDEADDERSDAESSRAALRDAGLLAVPAPSEAEFLVHEIWDRRLYLRHGLSVPPGGVVVDAGANVGAFALFCLAEAEGVTVHCFEPAQTARRALARNLRRWIHGGRVHVHPEALGAAEGDSELLVFSDAPGESTRHPEERDRLDAAARSAECVAEYRELLARHGTPPEEVQELAAEAAESARSGGAAAAAERQPVRVTTLSAALFARPPPDGVRQVDLLKVDVEGDEEEVLLGVADAHWPRVMQVVAEVYDHCGRLGRVEALLRRQGFEVTSEPQRPAVIGGYVMFVPTRLGLHFVYARRRGRES